MCQTRRRLAPNLWNCRAAARLTARAIATDAAHRSPLLELVLQLRELLVVPLCKPLHLHSGRKLVICCTRLGGGLGRRTPLT